MRLVVLVTIPHWRPPTPGRGRSQAPRRQKKKKPRPGSVSPGDTIVSWAGQATPVPAPKTTPTPSPDLSPGLFRARRCIGNRRDRTAPKTKGRGGLEAHHRAFTKDQCQVNKPGKLTGPPTPAPQTIENGYLQSLFGLVRLSCQLETPMRQHEKN